MAYLTKKSIFFWGVFLLLSSSFHACHPEQMPSETLLARVAEDAITVGQFQDWLVLERMSYPEEALKNQDTFQKIKEKLLNEQIDQILLLRQATQENVELDPKELEEELRQYKNQYSELSFQETLQENRVNPEIWLSQKKNALKIRKFLEQKLKQDTAVQLQQLLDYYEANPNEFIEPPAVRVRQLVTDQEAKAKQLRERVLQGENFAKLAQDHSLSPDRKRGGDLGFIVKGQVPEDFNICFELNPGEISEVVKSPYGFHLFKVLARRAEIRLPFTEVKEKIRGLLQRKQQEEARKNLLFELRQKYTVTINGEVLAKIR